MRHAKFVLSILVFTLILPAAQAATIVVNTLADTEDPNDGATTLREAIVLANQTSVYDHIAFNINNLGFGPPPHKIMVGSPSGNPLPMILYPIDFDGTSEPDFILTGTIAVVLDGTNAVSSSQAALLFEPGSDGSLVRGLAIRHFVGDAIVFQTEGNRVELSAIEGNGGTGVVVSEDKNTKIIGNVISGNDQHGIHITGFISPLLGHCVISKNIITANGHNGVSISSGHNSVFENIVSLNGDSGIVIAGGTNADENEIHGNLIGTDANGAVIGNTNFGISIAGDRNNVGGLDVRRGQAGNVIAYNGRDGVRVSEGLYNTIRGNSIHSNGALGIDLAPAGVTPNDNEQDADTGANNLQNYPVLIFASPIGSSMVVRLKFHSNLSTSFRIDFYLNKEKDPSGYGEGQTYHYTHTLTTFALPHTILADVTMPSAPMGYYITATATDQYGNTSEFSNAVQNGSRAGGNQPPNP